MLDFLSSLGGSAPLTKRIDQKDVVDSDPEALAEVSRTALSEGVMKHPVVSGFNVFPADYYRKGGPSRTIPSGIDEGRVYRDPSPRLLGDPEVESTAVLRLYGRPNRQPTAKPTDLIPPYSKFFLESVQEGHMERSQVVETFGDFFVFFFGERPATYTFSGTLLNAENVNWAEDFYFYYDNFLRGTKCVEAGAVLIMTYGYRQVEGFLLGVNMAVNAVSERGVALTFQMLITDRKYLKLSPDFGVLQTTDNKFIKDTTLLEMMKKGTSSGIYSEAYQNASDVANKKKAAASTSQPKAGDASKVNQKYSVNTSVNSSGNLVA